MVQDYGEERVFRSDILKRLAASVAAVIPSDHPDTGFYGGRIGKDAYPCFFQEGHGLVLSRYVFVVAGAGVHGGLDAAEDRGIVPLHGRTKRSVENVSGEEHQIRILGIYHVHPAGYFPCAVMVADMKIAREHDRDGVSLDFSRADFKTLPVFMMVVDPSSEKQQRNGSRDSECSCR